MVCKLFIEIDKIQIEGGHKNEVNVISTKQ